MNPPAKWESDAADIAREERKREESPSSFFFSQGKALILAIQYFSNERIGHDANWGTAEKHRRRIHLALFGQLMAGIEFLFKDFIASVVDVVSIFDDQLSKAKWIQVDTARVLTFRSEASSPGSLLIHPTQGWHSPVDVNERYKSLFKREPIAKDEIQSLERLWILRHSVAHNAGFVTAYDAIRGGMPNLRDSVAAIDAAYIAEAFEFLKNIARRVADEVGNAVLKEWLKSRVAAGPDYSRDEAVYAKLKLLAICVEDRRKELPEITEDNYSEDFEEAKRDSA